jgi:hypothetical protein
MLPMDTEERNIFVWGKTYPELSKKYIETVCTAGVLEDGTPVRLYPISYRYLSEQFKLYQWISARIKKNKSDFRPESYKIDADSIRPGPFVPPTPDEWGKRAAILFKNPCWLFESVEALVAAQRACQTSIGVVTPRVITKIEVVNRGEDEEKSFQQKLQELKRIQEARRRQIDMFENAIPPEMKRLEFVGARLQISWSCYGANCSGHRMQVLDWGVCELQRRNGNDAAVQKLQDVCDLGAHALRLFLGNLYLHPASFVIVGLWYPKRANLLF